MRQRRGLRHVLLTMEATPYLDNYSTMFERTHSQVVVDDGKQTYIHKNRQPMMTTKTYNDKQQLQHTMPYQKIIQADSA